jgi:hypothetical protein
VLAGLVEAEKVGRVRECRLGPAVTLGEAGEWVEGRRRAREGRPGRLERFAERARARLRAADRGAAGARVRPVRGPGAAMFVDDVPMARHSRVGPVLAAAIRLLPGRNRPRYLEECHSEFWDLAAGEQLSQLGGPLQVGPLREAAPRAWPDGPETVEHARAGRRSHHRGHQTSAKETSGDGALDWGPAGADDRGPGPVGGHGGDRPRSLISEVTREGWSGDDAVGFVEVLRRVNGAKLWAIRLELATWAYGDESSTLN